MPPGFQPRGDGPRGGATLKDLRGAATVWRLFRYVFRNYKVRIGVVLLCIVVTSLTSLASSLFTRMLIDDYITPGNITGMIVLVLIALALAS